MHAGRWLVGALTSGLALACSASMPPPASGADASTAVDAGGPVVLVGPAAEHSFLPPSLTVPVGTTVHWLWESGGHNVVSGLDGTPDGAFCSPTNARCGSAPTSNAGTTYEHTFTRAGTYPYFCAPHASDGMKGTIVVQ